MDLVHLKINGQEVAVEKGSTILDAARQAGFNIPTLCYLRDMNEIGACRMCIVEVKGARSLVASCVYPVSEGMEVFTNTPAVQKSRRLTLELILSTHERKCLSCKRSGTCELQQLSHDLGVEDELKYEGAVREYGKDESCAHLIRDNSKCILCRRCEAACAAQNVGVIGVNARGFDSHIGCAFEKPLSETSCVSCGQCITVCPTGALTERDDTEKVWAALADPTKTVIVETAPAVRAALGEEFGMPIGTDVEGKMVAALRRLGFDRVFDTNFSADLTIMEEATELVGRIQNGGTLPMITSCSPGWINYCEHYYPDLLGHLSTCKSPQQMFGAMAKTWYAKREGIDPKDLFVVSIMPCTAKKFEIGRDDQDAAGVPDVDVALTTRELARMIKRAKLDFPVLPDERYDDPLGESTGAAVIFGATGGVMEAALRTAAEWLTGDAGAPIEFKDVRGVEGIKEASYTIGGLNLKVAVASGLKNAAELLDKIRSGEADYQFIEIMCCPGGCVNGGGQPIQPAVVRNNIDLRAERAKALYANDANKPLRKSHDNPSIKAVYDEFLGKPGSHVAHEILHTSYKEQGGLK